MEPANLQYLHRNQIDTTKWDQCIANAANGLVYAYSFYLDHMATQWDALVLGDYEAVMPLPWRKKFGIRYLYQPPFTQQLGIFKKAGLTEEMGAVFLDALPAHFRFAEILLNYAHRAKALPQRTNFVLPLQEPYTMLQKRYKNVLLKNLKRANRLNISYSGEADYKMILDAYKELYGNRTPHVTDNDYAHFEKLCTFLPKENRVVRAVKKDGQLLSGAVLLRDKNRLYLLVSVTLPEGRSCQANHFLLDRLIDEFAESDLMLDFEGSDLPGIAQHYSNFGAVDQPYFFYRYNKLPWPVRLLK
jgi:hypothetical protein